MPASDAQPDPESPPPISLYADGDDHDQETVRVDPPLLDTDSQRLMHSLWASAIDGGASQDETIKRRVDNHRTKSQVLIQSRFIGTVDDAASSPIDYELRKPLGAGGMGVVYEARQSSINRPIAIKMLNPDYLNDSAAREAFIAEAEILGHLDHPNIVSIFEVGHDQQSTPFYSMQFVRGNPWSASLAAMSLAENLDVLLAVADAVGFAHSCEIIHRDIKPENVMIGSFGEVTLMDWGMAAPVGGLQEKTGWEDDIGGTPAYMPPEVALGERDTVGVCSDIYLLGATLYEIVSGKRPHSGESLMDCLRKAARNEIQQCAARGELLSVALRAMATDPSERYATVRDFQTAVRDYLRHHESSSLCGHADENLAQGRIQQLYASYDQAIAAFQEAIIIWPENIHAKLGVEQALLEKATLALQKGDLDLADSLLLPALPAHAAFAKQVAKEQRKRHLQRRRFHIIRAALLALLASVGLYFALQALSLYIQLQTATKRAADAEASLQKLREEPVTLPSP